MSDNVGTVYMDVAVNQPNFGKIGNSWAPSFSKMGGGLGKFLGTAAIVAAVGQFAKASIEMGSNLTEVQNVVDVTFGAMSSSISDWAKSASTAYGLNELQGKKFTGTMGAMLKSTGFGTKAAAEMSTTLAGLSGDFASFYNLNSEDAFAKIRSGISGETEPLKQLGINMSVANMEAFAMSRGMGKAYSSMTQLEQAQLRYNYLLGVSKDAQGDFARTSGSWANQTRILTNQWDSFKASFGQGLINLFTPILRGVNNVIAGLVTFGNVFREVTAGIFGDAGGSISTVAVTSQEAAGGMSDLAAQTNAAGKAASGSLASFDKLNVLADADTGSGGAAGGLAIATTAGEATDKTSGLNAQLSDVSDTIKDIVKRVREFGILIWDSGMENGFKELGDAWGHVKGIVGDLYVGYTALSDWADKNGITLALTPKWLGEEFGKLGTIIAGVTGLLDNLFSGNFRGAVFDAKKILGTLFDPSVESMNLFQLALYNFQHPIKGFFLTTIELVRRGWNAFANMINGFANKTVVPVWQGASAWSSPSGYQEGTEYGGQSYTRPQSAIPKMASGGIVDQPMLAMVGDNRSSAEAIVPIDQLQGMIQAAMAQGGGGNSEVIRLLTLIWQATLAIQFPSEFNIDGKKAGEVLLEPVMQAAKRRNYKYPIRST